MKIQIISLLLIMFCSTLAYSQNNLSTQPLKEEFPRLTYIVIEPDPGFNGRVAELLRDTFNSEEKITSMDRKEAYKYAEENPNIIIIASERTPDLEKQYNWVGPLNNKHALLYAKKGVNISITSLEEAREVKQIATKSNDIYDQYLRLNGFSNIVNFESYEECIKRLIAEDVKLVVLEDRYADKITDKIDIPKGILVPVFGIMDSSTYLAISKKTSDKVINELNRKIDGLKEDGTLNNLWEKYQDEVSKQK